MAATAVEGQGRLVEVEPAAVVVLERRPAGEEKTFRPYDPEQVLLLAPVLSEWIPEGDLAHFRSMTLRISSDRSTRVIVVQGINTRKPTRTQPPGPDRMECPVLRS